MKCKHESPQIAIQESLGSCAVQYFLLSHYRCIRRKKVPYSEANPPLTRLLDALFSIYIEVLIRISSKEAFLFWESLKYFSRTEHFQTLHSLFTACSRPSIFHRQIYFCTACFELFGGGHSHLATLQ
jgi:hypothetical protein